MRVLHRPDAVQDQAGDGAEAGVGALEDEGARCVLAGRVPRSDDEDETWGDAALGDGHVRHFVVVVETNRG